MSTLKRRSLDRSLPSNRVPKRAGKEDVAYTAVQISSVSDAVTKEFKSSEVQEAMPIFRTSPVQLMSAWIDRRAKRAEEKELEKPQQVGWMTLLRYSTAREKWIMLVGLFMAAVSGLCLPAWLVLLALSLNRFSTLANLINAIGGSVLQSAVQEQLNNLVIGFVILGAVSLFTGSTYVGLWTYTGEKQALRIKEKYVKSALKQDAKFFDLHNREKMSTEVANAMVHINGAIGRQMADVWANAWCSMGCLVVAFLLNWQVAFLMMCIVPVAVIFIMILAFYIRKNSREAGMQFASAGALATEVISGIKTIASLCAEKWALERYESLARNAQKSSVFAGYLAGLSAGITGFLFYIIYVIAFAYGTELVAENSGFWQFIGCFFEIDGIENCNVNGAAIMCCIYGVIICATFFGLMAPGLNAINQGRQAAVHVFETINRVPEIDASSEEGLKLENFEGAVEFRNVSFAYPSRPEDPIYRDFNLAIEPGTSVALVGPSGSGKSTVAKLLLRFYDPLDGDLLVDGVPLQNVNIQWWRSQVGYVAQEPILFPGSLMDNIRAGDPSASDEKVIAAAKAACADEFITAMPDGYDTFYSGTSVQLSGGQLQRICIARAIVRDPTILLLDEATSALDTNSERHVQEAIENIRKTKQLTIVTIAHRLSTIVSSDKIAVISDGGIEELGAHRSLLEAGGIYANLCESQGITLESFDAGNADAPTAAGELLEHPNGSAAAPVEKDIEDGLVEVTETEKDPEEEKLANLSRLWAFSKKDWGYMLMGVIGAVIVGALSPAESILTAQIVANFYTKEQDEMMDANWPYILGFFAFAVAALVGNLLMGCGMSVSGCRLTRRARVLVFEAIIRRSMGWFDYPEHSTGELTSRLEGDAESVAKVTGWSLGYRIRVFVSLTTGVVIALAYSWQIGLTAIACVPMIMAPALIQKICLSKRFALQQDGLSPSTILEQGLRGINSVQAYNLQDEVFDQYSESLKPEQKGKTRKGIIVGSVYGLSQGAIFCSFALVFWVGSELLTQEKVDFVSFFTPVLAVMFGAVAVAQVNADFNATQDGRAAAARIFSIVDEPLDDKDPFGDEGEQPDGLDGSIVFQSINFHYPTMPNNPVYYPSKDRDGFSLSILSKESVAFVGKSGSGKSTALQILLRFYDPSSGDVLVDARDIKGLNVAWLRGKIGYVGQMPVLFAGTVRENILLGKRDATEEQVINAAKAANAHEFIMDMSQGYDTDIGTGGSLLSGGQRQRVAIARAVVSDPQILVLDEATAALDNVSERVVQAALDDLQVKQPRTTLVVAHRLVTVKNCDKIAVLGTGGVKELGTHERLLSEKGLYYELWMKQVGAKEEERE